MLKAFKNSALYISAIIGAGFASGSEITLFFEGQSLFVVILAGIMLGGFSGIFLHMGNLLAKKNSRLSDGSAGDLFALFPRRRAAFLRAAFLLSSFITLAAMTAGAESIFASSFDIRHMGIISVVPAVIIAAGNLEKIKSAFIALIAVVAALIVWLFVAGRSGIPWGGGFNVLKAVSYTSMNVFLGGYLLVKDRRAERGEIAATAVVSAAVMTALLIMIHSISGGASGEMPVITAAQKIGGSRAAAIIVFLAVFSTMISTAKATLKLTAKKLGKPVSASIMISSSLLISLIGFKSLIEYAYPFISLLSSAFTAVTAVFLIASQRAKDGRGQKRNGTAYISLNSDLDAPQTGQT
ncbi:MAG: hypothetical protein LBQ40_06220 [Clostridiales bacterium]|jgi:uncharacterized membrane protein YkvI|nr:hypothetical protein [Clostridiales bacterium]